MKRVPVASCTSGVKQETDAGETGEPSETGDKEDRRAQ